jgi:hypothetical protein
MVNALNMAEVIFALYAIEPKGRYVNGFTVITKSGKLGE